MIRILLFRKNPRGKLFKLYSQDENICRLRQKIEITEKFTGIWQKNVRTMQKCWMAH